MTNRMRRFRAHSWVLLTLIAGDIARGARYLWGLACKGVFWFWQRLKDE